MQAVGFDDDAGRTHLIAGVPAVVLVGVGSSPLDLPGARDVGAAIARPVRSATEFEIVVEIDAGGWKTRAITGSGARLLVDALERFGA